MTRAELESVAKGIAPVVREAIAAATAPLLARITQLEQRKGLSFKGSWNHTTAYSEGDLALRGSALWACLKWHAGQMPGTPDGSGFWQLVVKSQSPKRDTP